MSAGSDKRTAQIAIAHSCNEAHTRKIMINIVPKIASDLSSLPRLL
jgi:hypothetical protein